MNDSARLLQERLEQLEAGELLDACLADLPEDEADLLRLAASLGEVQYPARNSDIVAAQRAGLLKLTAKEKKMEHKPPRQPRKTWIRLQSKRLLPLAAILGAALLFLCVLVAVIGGRLAWRSYQDARLAQHPSPSPGLTSAVVVQNPSPSPTFIPKVNPSQSPPRPTAGLTYDTFLPIMVVPEISDPKTAALRNPLGLVQVRTGDGDWTTVSARRSVGAGQRIRTGPLSSAELAFYDGSRVHLGPNTEVSIDKLDARVTGGPRLVALTQWVGETEHDVASASSNGSLYQVHTPSGTGEARGTLFHVLVTTEHLTRFGVDEGAVAVTSLSVTVVVVAGQATTVEPEQPPAEPVFRITGEGEVTQTGLTWIVAGQTFETDDDTVIVGNPQVGDWVSVEGRLLPDGTHLADRIVLLRRAPENRFTITGPVEVITGTTWTVAGQAIVVDDETDVEVGIESGDLVRVEGVIQQDGTLLAECISLVEEERGSPFDFVGVVQDIITDTWTVSGVAIAIDDETEIQEGLAISDVVRVRGWILDDETWLARSIERFEEKEREREFEFTGYVESLTPWVVSGIAFETDEWTEIEPGIGLDDRVRVEGRILEDGAWLATEIERLDDEDEALHIVFVGIVTSQDPWLVSGIPLVVDDETDVEDDVSVGDLVKVKAQILPDGTWLAKEIERVEIERGLGCFSVSAVVIGVNADQVTLDNWPPINLDEDVEIDGEIKVSSVILILVCVDADGAIHIVSVVVIYQPAPVIEPPPPSPLPPPDDGSAKVAICHKTGSGNHHTLTVDRSALQAHLNHGDTLGPCPDRDDDDHDDDDDDDDDD
jgi:hypothetical protein